MLVACLSAAMAPASASNAHDPGALGQPKRERADAAEQIGDQLGVADLIFHQPRQGLFACRGRLQK